MDLQMLLQATLTMGLVLGAVLLLAAVYVFVRHQKFGLGGGVLVAFGTVLLGLSLWQSVELSVGPEGGITAKFQKDLGAQSADLKGALAALDLKLTNLAEDVLASRGVSTGGTMTPSSPERLEKQQQFNRNAAFSVLIFYKPYQKSKARAMESALLSNGYKSSATPTDLSESLKQYSENEAWIIYTDRGAERTKDVEVLLKSLDPGVTYDPNSKASPLRRGDVQVLLF